VSKSVIQVIVIGVIVLFVVLGHGGWATFFAVLLVLSCL
jgi:hypothetical protein